MTYQHHQADDYGQTGNRPTTGLTRYVIGFAMFYWLALAVTIVAMILTRSAVEGHPLGVQLIVSLFTVPVMLVAPFGMLAGLVAFVYGVWRRLPGNQSNNHYQQWSDQQ